jgi:hypothetical protein
MSAIVTLGSAIYLLSMTVLLYGAMANGVSTLKADRLMPVDFSLVVVLALGNFFVFANLLRRLNREERAFNTSTLRFPSAPVQGNGGRSGETSPNDDVLRSISIPTLLEDS